MLAGKADANVSNGTFDCDEGKADYIQSWSSFKKTFCCQMKNFGCMNWTQLANGYCSPTGTSVNATYNFASGQGKEGCKDECDLTPTCNFAIYNSASGVCSMNSHEVSPTNCTNEEKFWSFWKPPSQAAPALAKDATTTTTTPLRDDDAPVFLAPSSTLPLFFQTTATPYRPPDPDKGGWKLERVPDARVPDYAGKPPSAKPGAKDPDGGRGSPYAPPGDHDMGPVAPEEPPSTSPNVLEAEPAPAPDMGPVAPMEIDSTTGPAEPPTGAGVAATGFRNSGGPNLWPGSSFPGGPPQSRPFSPVPVPTR